MTKDDVLNWIETALELSIDRGVWEEEPPELNPHGTIEYCVSPDNPMLRFPDGSMWEIVVHTLDDYEDTENPE